MLHSSDINDIVNAKWHYILSDQGHIPTLFYLQSGVKSAIPK